MALIRKLWPKACPVCGSPDASCGGHPDDAGPVVVEIPDEPTPAGDVGGPDMVTVEKPNHAGAPMRVLYPRARANREGLKIVHDPKNPDEKKREPKTTGRTKKTASDKRRSSSSNKSKTTKSKSE